MKTFTLGIKVTVTGHTGANLVSPLVNDAIQELVNRADFKRGLIGVGRVLTHEIDYGKIQVTIDLERKSEYLGHPV